MTTIIVGVGGGIKRGNKLVGLIKRVEEKVPMKIDCSKTENYFKEKKRMTKGCCDCTKCLLSARNNECGTPCGDYEIKHTKKSIEIVQKWSDEHYVKNEKKMNTRELLWAKVNPNAIIPTKRDEDAGYDIYACLDEDYIIIQPHETVLIPTGIASAFPSDYVVILKERGSTGTKGMGQRCGVIDSGYRNEYFVPITNHNDKDIVIVKDNYIKYIGGVDSDCIVYPASKAICQAILLPVPKVTSKEVSYEELLGVKSERGVGNLGSSGK